MGIHQRALDADLFYGKVIRVDSKNRLIDVLWANMGINKVGVPVINPPGDYSLPAVGSSGLVIGSDVQGHYFLGKVDFGYARKVAGIINPDTDHKYKVRKVVEDGENYYANPIIGSGLHLSNTGNMSLTHPSGDGLKYSRNRMGAPLRLLQLIARTIQQQATNTSVSFGSVLRRIPSKGYTLIRDISGLSAQEFNVGVSNGPVEVAKFILGNVVDKAGIGEFSAFGSRVFAFLKTGLTPVTEASIKLDEPGNIEINAASTAQVSLTGLLINLGKTLAPEPVVKGITFQGLVNTLLGAEQAFLGAEQAFLTGLSVYQGAMVSAVALAAPPNPMTPLNNNAAILAMGVASGLFTPFLVTYLGSVTAYNTAISTYVTGLTTALSTVVKTT